MFLMNTRGYYHGLANEQRLVEPIFQGVNGSSALCASPQALSAARKKITPEAYQILSRQLVAGFYADDDLLLWRGQWRLLAIDGSTLQIPSSKEAIAAFGVCPPATFPLARISVLYDVHNRFVLDTVVGSYQRDEREMAMEHVEFCSADTTEHSWSDIVLADMNYPCFYLMLALGMAKKEFVFRYAAKGAACIAEVSEALAQGGTDTVITIDLCKPGRVVNPRLAPLLGQRKAQRQPTTLRLRLVAVTLNNGTREILLTSLLHNDLGAEDFKELYNERWAVEGYYDVVKNVLRLESFHTKSLHCIMQDIYAAMLLANFLALALYDVREDMQDFNAGAERRRLYAINTTQALSTLRQRLIALVICQDTDELQRILDELRIALMRHKVPIRKERPQTNSQRKKKHNHMKHSHNTKKII
jgi:hypothetical protein